MSDKHDERRTHKRFQVSGVEGQFLFSTDATVIDMSLNGMSIETNNPLKVGREYTLKLNRSDGVIELQGTVVWCTLVRTARDPRGDVVPVYRAGLHFEDVITGRAARLLDFIHKNAIVSLENRLFGRFRAVAGQPADLGFESDFRVRQLGMAGMSVETDAAPKPETRCAVELEVGEATLKTIARVVHVDPIDPKSDDSAFLLGVQFLELKGKSREALENFINEELDN